MAGKWLKKRTQDGGAGAARRGAAARNKKPREKTGRTQECGRHDPREGTLIKNKIEHDVLVLVESSGQYEADKNALGAEWKKLEEKQTEANNKWKVIQKENEISVNKKRDLDDRDAKLKIEMLKPAAMKKEAEGKFEKAKAALAQSNKLLGDAEEKENKAKEKAQEAEDHYKKVLEEYDKLKKLLKAKVTLEDRRKIINTIGRIGPLPGPANFDLHDIYYELCDIAVKETKLRGDALTALHKVEREFGGLADKLINLPKDTDILDYTKAIQKLPNFGRAGLPLIQAHFKMKGGVSLNSEPAWAIFLADLKVLAEIAKKAGEEEGFQILVAARTSPFAKEKWKYPTPFEGDRHENRILGAVGNHLREVCIARPLREAEKKKAIDYFILLIKSRPAPTYYSRSYKDILSEDCMNNRKLGCQALGSIGVDAKRAVDELKKLEKYDRQSFPTVSKAAGSAIAKIEGNAK